MALEDRSAARVSDFPLPSRFGAEATEDGLVRLHFDAPGFGIANVTLVAEDAESLADEMVAAIKLIDAMEDECGG